MHLLIILLDQLLGMLRSARKARQAEVVVPRQNEPGGSDPAASGRLWFPGHGWMTVLPVWGGGPVRPPGGPLVHVGRLVRGGRWGHDGGSPCGRAPDDPPAASLGGAGRLEPCGGKSRAG
ncbi:MAG: hypothetical protein WD403_07715 [Pirellulales bacterium]